MVIKHDYEVIFDDTPVGSEATRSFIIENGQKYKNWNIIQYSEFKPCLNAFTVKKKVTKYGNKEKHEVFVTYKPLQAEQTNLNYYKLINLGETDSILFISGQATGVCVYSTVKYLNFYRTPNENKVKTTFEIHNKSTCKIYYNFDIDNSQKVFEILPKKGEIDPGRYIYIKAHFVIQQNGVYFMDLPCLIMFHSPIYIELMGVNSSRKLGPNLKLIHGQGSQSSLENNYEKYFCTSLGILDSNPICCIKPKFLNFALSTNKIYSFTELQNFTEKCILVIWDIEAESNVTVEPKQLYMRDLQRSSFEVKFVPKMLETMYGGSIYGRAIIFGENQTQTDPETVVVPLALHYIGNTFKKTQVWTPQVQIQPVVLTMPVCISQASVYNTMKIKRLGQYPILFEFRLPKNTRFEVKPKQGIIRSEIQIVAVKFTGGNEVNETVEEKWKVVLNQSEKVYSEISIKVSVQEPMLTVNVNNRIEFGAQFPKFKKYITVPLENITLHKIKYTFHPNKWYTLDNCEGILDSFACTQVTFCLTCDCDLPEICYMTYNLNVLLGNVLISKLPYVKNIELVSKCVYGTLCSAPTTHNFETLVCGEEKSTTFHIYNFSEVTLHYILKIYGHYGATDENPITVHPNMGSIAPGAHHEITVLVHTLYSTLSTYCVYYHLCESEGSDKLIENTDTFLQINARIFQIHYFSFYPTLKFIEIGRNTTGCIFTKLNVWEYFRIDGFNELLRTIRMNETKQYEFRVPDAEARLHIMKNIAFIVKNISREETSLSFEQKKICDCELKEVKMKSGIGSIRKYDYADCPHKNLVELTVADNIIQPYCTTTIDIDIAYTLYNKHKVCFLMHLSHNRCIEIYIEVIGLHLGQLSTFTQGFHFKMKDVYIGSLNTDIQIYWFSNNTRASSFYKLYTANLDKYNKIWGFPVITCINPEEYVLAKSCHSIRFLFSPIMPGDIKIELPFKFGSQNTTLTITGSAKPYFVSPLETTYYVELGKKHHKLDDILITMSTEHIVLRSLPTHCVTKRILTMKNISNTDTIGFTFDEYTLKDIISGKITPTAGFLLPSERIPLILTLKSAGVSCPVRICIACHLVNHTEFEEHVNTSSNYFQETELRYDMFCIGDDNAVNYPQLPATVVTPAPKVFHRVISISCHIIPQVDLDVKMTIQDQLKQTPFHVLKVFDPNRLYRFLSPRKQDGFLKGLETSQGPTVDSDIQVKRTEFRDKKSCLKKCCVTFTDEEFVAVHTVLSCLLSDNIFNNKFQHCVSLSQNKKHKVYSQYKVNLLTPQEEKDQLHLILNKIPLKYLAETMQIILCDALMKYLQLGQYPFDSINCDSNDQPAADISANNENNYSRKFMFLFDK